jgi:multimeric flavodoxin WrbA
MLEKRGFETEMVNLYEYNIHPCSHCNYECFKGEKCPINDDIPRIYEKILDADVLVFAIPTYGSNVSGLYKAWAERGQAIMKGLKDYKRYIASKIKGFIVIGSVPGGDKAFHVVMPEYCESEYRTAAVLLQPNESGKPRAWLEGNITESDLIKLRLKHFANTIWKEWKRKQRTMQKTN